MFKRTIRESSRSYSRFAASRLYVTRPRLASRVYKYAMVTGAISYLTYHYQTQQNFISNEFEQAQLHPDDSVCVDQSLTPFPIKLTANEYPVATPYSLIAFGRRAVTFMKFNIYGLGIYVSDRDLLRVPEVFNSSYLSKNFIDTDSSKTHKQNLEGALKDPKTSMALVSYLLDSDIEMIVKITPMRNTDFNHLRDGLSRSTMSHPDAKKYSEEIKDGIKEFKNAFSIKGSVPKNDDLLLKKNKDNTLELYHKAQNGEIKKLGTCNNPLVGKCLFGKYLSVPKPLSPGAQEVFVEKVVQLV